jgi:cyanophycinase
MVDALRSAWIGLVILLLLGVAHADDNPFGLPEKAQKGSLVIAGGGTMPDSVYEKFVELAGGKNAKLVVIPWASAFSSFQEARQRYFGWLRTPVASVKLFEADSRDKANDKQYLAALAEATGVWITGGNQARLASLYGNTEVNKALSAVLERGGVIGGTSAGASVMSQKMIDHGESEAVLAAGFGLVRQAVIDSHFSQRRRHSRLLSALEQHPEQLGLGIDENTAVVIHSNLVQVLGDSSATICIPHNSGKSAVVYRLDPGEKAALINNGREGLALRMSQ